ncbi:MAG: hypothetical protein ABEJ40_10865 [Haloarculaceae archaeon]
MDERTVKTVRERVFGWEHQPSRQYRLATFALWQLVVLFYVLGDTGLTAVVLELGGFEASPVARAFVDAFGYLGLVLQKALALAVLWLLWRYYPAVGVDSPDPWRLVVPLIPFLRGVQLVAIHLSNIAVLL